MVHFIRGFSLLTGYSCTQCHMKCCSTEYDLPILNEEKEKIIQKYPLWMNLIQSSAKENSILRGDSCPFLNGEGFCILHDTKEKPLICKIYPLIFYKIKQDLFLTWISPCRGNGFQWVSKPENRILNSYIDEMIIKANPHYTKYFGEEIDKNNPYNSVSVTRINEQQNFFSKLCLNNEEANLYSNSSPNHNKVVRSLVRKVNDLPFQDDLNDIINAVFHWLCWSPVGLQLSLNNSLLVFQVAGYWIDLWGRKLLMKSELPMNRERILQQLGSFYATSILPSFWNQVMKKAAEKPLKKFSNDVYLVLKGVRKQKNFKM